MTNRSSLSPSLLAAARLSLGLLFTVFGADGFLHLLPQPAVPPEAGAFLGALGATGYMFPLIKGTELAAGLLLLSGRLVPLALLLLAPVVVNIVAFTVALSPANPLAAVVLAGELLVAWGYRDAFRGVLEVRPAPVHAGAAGAARASGAGAHAL